MGFLIRDARSSIILSLSALASLVVAGGCYSPQLEDCAVACKSADDCGPDQACGDDGWCAGEDAIGRCDGSGAGSGSGDPAATSQLRVIVSGLGAVELLSNSQSIDETCTSSSGTGTGATCTYQVRPGAWVSLREKASGGARFAGWDFPSCTIGRPKTCLVRVSDSVTTAGARFEGGGPGGPGGPGDDDDDD